MSRAAFLPSVGDPMFMNTFFDLYERYWKSAVDKVYIYMMCSADEKIVAYITQRAEALGMKIWHHEGQCAYDIAINTMLAACEEDSLVILEDDVFILQPNGLEENFLALESGEYDCVGSSRGCMTAGLTSKVADKFYLKGQISPEHSLADCPSVWPSMFFVKTEMLKRTDCFFGPKQWPAGTYIPELDWTTTEVEVGDAFVNTTFQLRALGCKFKYIHQLHASSYDITCFPSAGMFKLKEKGILPWVHFGSLSTGFHGLIRDSQNVPLGLQSSPPTGLKHLLPKENRTHIMEEYARRMSCFVLLAEYAKIQDTELNYYNEIYSAGVQSCIEEMGLDVTTFVKVYKSLLSDVWGL